MSIMHNEEDSQSIGCSELMSIFVNLIKPVQAVQLFDQCTT